MRAPWRNLAPHALPLLKELQVITSTGQEEDYQLVATGDIGYLEHLIHECAHAVSLGLEFNRGVSDRISKKIDRYNPKNARSAHAEETRTWAIEWLVWKKLKMTPRPLLWGDLEDHASIQGVYWRDIRSVLKKDREIRGLADSVFEKITLAITDLEAQNATSP